MNSDLLIQFGATRSAIKARHALLTPESHERVTMPGWNCAEFVYLVTPDLGAKFAMALVDASGNGTSPRPAEGIARFVFCLEGSLELSDGIGLASESYAFLPAGDDLQISYMAGARFVLFEWAFLAQGSAPGRVTAKVADVDGRPLRGDDRLIVQKLLPAHSDYDCEFNVMTFEPGSTLPYVETHFMEHGLLFLNGGGVYRLDASWYPVQKGDAIWMGPHAPQWFGALGRKPSRYLIYKNYNRSPLERR